MADWDIVSTKPMGEWDVVSTEAKPEGVTETKPPGAPAISPPHRVEGLPPRELEIWQAKQAAEKPASAPAWAQKVSDFTGYLETPPAPPRTESLLDPDYYRALMEGGGKGMYRLGKGMLYDMPQMAARSFEQAASTAPPPSSEEFFGPYVNMLKGIPSIATAPLGITEAQRQERRMDPGGTLFGALATFGGEPWKAKPMEYGAAVGENLRPPESPVAPAGRAGIEQPPLVARQPKGVATQVSEPPIPPPYTLTPTEATRLKTQAEGAARQRLKSSFAEDAEVGQAKAAELQEQIRGREELRREQAGEPPVDPDLEAARQRIKSIGDVINANREKKGNAPINFPNILKNQSGSVNIGDMNKAIGDISEVYDDLGRAVWKGLEPNKDVGEWIEGVIARSNRTLQEDQRPGPLSKRLYESAVKFPTTMKKRVRTEAVKTAIEDGWTPSDKGMNLLYDRMDEKFKALDTFAEKTIRGSKERVSLKEGQDAIEGLWEEYKYLPDPKPFRAKMDQLKATLAEHGDTIDAYSAHKMKQAIYRLRKDAYEAVHGPAFAEVAKKADQRVAGVINEQLRNFFPEYGPLNKAYSRLTRLEPLLERATNRIRNLNLLGMGGGLGGTIGAIAGHTLGATLSGSLEGALTGAAIFKLIDDPHVKTQLAFMLNRVPTQAELKAFSQKAAANLAKPVAEHPPNIVRPAALAAEQEDKKPKPEQAVLQDALKEYKGLSPAIKTDKGIITDGPSSSHDALAAKNDLDVVEDDNRGFTLDGKTFMSRTQALEWIKKNEPDIFEKVKAKSQKEGLHSGDYARAKGIKRKKPGVMEDD